MKRIRGCLLSIAAVAVALLALAVPEPAEAGIFGKRRECRGPQCRAGYVQPTALASAPFPYSGPTVDNVPVATPAVEPARTQMASKPVAPTSARPTPSSFVGWLNAVRATYGLPPVVDDPLLARWAAVNNSHQAARGMGHYVMGPARYQNSAVGTAESVGWQWLASPDHARAMLAPEIRFAGLARYGSYWTLNLR